MLYRSSSGPRRPTRTRLSKPCARPYSSRRPTSMPHPTTAATSPRSSPFARSSRRREAADGHRFPHDDPRRGQRRRVRAGGRRQAAPDPLHPRRPRLDREPHRLRHGQLRGVLDPRRRPPGEELHAARRSGRRREDRDRRGARAERGALGAPAGVLGSPRVAVRVLHAGDADERDRVAAPERASERGRDPEGDPGEHLPLHRLREHRRGNPGGGRMTETTVTPERPLVVEEGETQPGFIGQNVPRKEDKRLVQGEGVFFDDLKRHEMGFVHFVRSPYAHARVKSVDVSKALELDGVYGTLTGDEVAILTDPFFQLSTPPGAHMKDYALA